MIISYYFEFFFVMRLKKPEDKAYGGKRISQQSDALWVPNVFSVPTDV